ncbi:hypothetical protein BHE74_00055980 [Ensete ventricosum]|nr:hypothetical protein BHE74_00055980 [Ensete ventricosum]RZS26917.1 hypothetical protein BHM03_00060340 [Ensete ventricosum]
MSNVMVTRPRSRLNAAVHRGLGYPTVCARSGIAIVATPMEEKRTRKEEEGEPVAVVAAAMVASEEEEAKGWGSGEEAWPRKGGGGGVMLEGYVLGSADGGVRGPGGVKGTRSLTDEDLEELKACLDLGFGFSYEGIPELCNTLPALELCYSMSQRFHLDDQHEQISPGDSLPFANWMISSPGSMMLPRSFLCFLSVKKRATRFHLSCLKWWIYVYGLVISNIHKNSIFFP